MKKGFLVVIVILISAAAYFFYQNSSNSLYETPSSGGTESSDSVDLVEVESNVAGSSVTIPRVVLSKPGFIMIHESYNGRAGSIVMTGDFLPEGESTEVVVQTGKTTEVGEKYFAMLHEDNGNGTYDNPGVDPPVYKGGKIVNEEFSIE